MCCAKTNCIGVIETPLGIINEDVYHLYTASNYKIDLSEINPFSFTKPIAPHIAANHDGQTLSSQNISHQIKSTMNKYKDKVDYLFIEGAGGAMLPLNDNETYLAILKQLQAPIILVVGMKLGCLNHSLLTQFAIKKLNLPIVGWIANQIDPNMAYYTANIADLTKTLNIPLLGTIGFNSKFIQTQCFNKVLRCQ